MRLLFLLFFLMTASVSWGQSVIITGSVTDAADGAPLVGVSVLAKNANKGVSTDANGRFQILANTDDILVVSYVGYNTRSVNVNGKTSIDIRLEAAASSLNQIVIVGTRGAGRVKTETPVPVDVVDVKQLTIPTARMDLTSIINYAAPSFNYNKQTGSDGADHVDLATLRGLGPDQTLVLVNGKRRHQTAFVAVFGTRGRGNSGTDLNALPASAIDRVEILRDGASAQYGSDAIAGVINLVLKKNIKTLSGSVGWSGYHDPVYNPYFEKDQNQYIHSDSPVDGGTIAADVNYGVPIGKNNGFLNLTLNYSNAAKTYRQVLNVFPDDPEGLPVNSVRRAYGDGSLRTYGAFANAEIPVGTSGTVVYAFGGYNDKFSDAYAYTRNFSARPGRFVTNADGSLIDVPGIIMTSGDGEQFFNPHIQTKVTDGSAAVGVRGSTGSGWTWDLSNSYGVNDFHFFGDKTFNASTGNPDKNHFDDGGFTFSQNTANLNFSKENREVLSGLNLAFGLEYRLENYQLYAGEVDSYKDYGLINSVDSTFDDQGQFVSLDTSYKAGGAQGFPGYQPSDEVDANRSTFGAYADVELDVTDKWLVEGAIRAENYSDFGFTTNFKLATRYKITDNLNIRASGSTGFRAPSLQQINFSSTYTTVQGGNISEVKIAPNYSPITLAAGIEPLKQERSTNASVGFTYRPVSEFSITLDGYMVSIKDRVVLSGQFDASDPDLNPDLVAALNNSNIALAQFFANAVNTTNRGIDMVFDYNKKFDNSSLRLVLAGNLQSMTIDSINVPEKLNKTYIQRKTFLSDREEYFIRASAPPAKFSFNAEYGTGKLTIGARLTYFGGITLLGYGDGYGFDLDPAPGASSLPKVPTDADESVLVEDKYTYGSKFVADLYLGYKIIDGMSLFVGVDNLLNTHPDLGVVDSARYWSFNTETGGPWDAVQMGINGRRLFARLAFNF
jgi:iron complex outermembrane receptor protein